MWVLYFSPKFVLPWKHRYHCSWEREEGWAPGTLVPCGAHGWEWLMCHYPSSCRKQLTLLKGATLHLNIKPWARPALPVYNTNSVLWKFALFDPDTHTEGVFFFVMLLQLMPLIAKKKKCLTWKGEHNEVAVRTDRASQLPQLPKAYLARKHVLWHLIWCNLLKVCSQWSGGLVRWFTKEKYLLVTATQSMAIWILEQDRGQKPGMHRGQWLFLGTREVIGSSSFESTLLP